MPVAILSEYNIHLGVGFLVWVWLPHVGVATCRVPSGELLEVVAKENNLTEAIAVSYLSQLLLAVETLHKLKIAHLDIRVSSHTTEHVGHQGGSHD